MGGLSGVFGDGMVTKWNTMPQIKKTESTMVITMVNPAKLVNS